MRQEGRKVEPRDNRYSKPEYMERSSGKEMRRCNHCGVVGHIRMNCAKWKKEKGGALEVGEYEEDDREDLGAMENQDWKQRGNNWNRNSVPFGKGNDYRSGNGFRRGNDSRRNDMAFGRDGGNRTWQRSPGSEKPNDQKVVCKPHKKEKCMECNEVSDTHTCNALLAEYVELKCGCTIPVVADACKVARKGNMPVSEGMVNNQKVSVLRDSGCSTIVVKRDLVEDSQLTGKDTVCVLIDGTIRRTPLAKIHIDTIYYKGDVEAVCMRNPLYELIVGNMKGIKERSIEETGSAVETYEEVDLENQNEVEEVRPITESDEDSKIQETQGVV